MNKTVIITGASRGLGKELAVSLYKKSYNLALVARNFDKEYIKAIKNNDHQKVAIYHQDLSTTEKVLEFCNDVKKDFTTIDLLINNVGYNSHKKPQRELNWVQYCFIGVTAVSPFQEVAC